MMNATAQAQYAIKVDGIYQSWYGPTYHAHHASRWTCEEAHTQALVFARQGKEVEVVRVTQ